MSIWNYIGGGSVFISHSHNDLPKVRLIRNKLEEKGFDPLCFYMQCLTDEDEIEGLLQNEIDARDWFAFVDSENSRASAWVKKERDYILNVRDKRVLFYSLEDSSPEDIADQIMDNMTVYVCYSERDREYGRLVAEKLSGMELRVYDRCGDDADLDDVLSEENMRRTEEAIKDAAKHGCFLYIMTDRSKQALLMRKELEYAVMYGASIAVAFLGCSPWDLSGDLQYLVSNADCAEIDEDISTGMEQIASLVGRALMQKASNEGQTLLENVD